MAINNVTITEKTRTTLVEDLSSSHEGQLTFFNSIRTPVKNSLIFLNILLPFFILQVWRDSNPQLAVLETAALPIELQTCHEILTCFFMHRMLLTPRTILFVFYPLRVLPFVLCSRVIPSFALTARQNNVISNFLSCHNAICLYSIISTTTPAPTVRPPSRIANRNSFSIATGTISSISASTLSPGITICTPSGNLIDPVTSVVRK